MTNFASSISRNLDRLSLDEDHCKRNELTRRSRPQGFGEGLANGLSGIGISLLGAIGGIAHHPLQAWLDPSFEKSLPAGTFPNTVLLNNIKRITHNLSFLYNYIYSKIF